MEIQAIELFIPLLVCIGAFLVTYSIIPVIIDVSYLKHLCDDSKDPRKLHTHSTPNLGGVAIFAAIFVVFALSGYALQTWSPYLAAGLTILFFSGIKDDILVISAWKKLMLQIIAVAALVWGSGLVISDLGGVFGFHEIPLWAGAALTFFTMVVIVNAYNLIDGIDGLAGGIGVIVASFFSWWFWQADMMAHTVIALTVTGSLLAFLRYNFQPASIFMGDTGSQIVGFVLAFLAVSFVDAGLAEENVGIVPLQNAIPVLALSVLIVPLYDTLRVFMVRAFTGQSPFQPDRRHIHHQLLDMGLSHQASCFVIYSFNITIIGLTVLLAYMEVNALLTVMLFATMILFPTVRIKRRLLSLFGIKMPRVSYLKLIEWDDNVTIVNMVERTDGQSISEGSEEYKESELGKAI